MNPWKLFLIGSLVAACGGGNDGTKTAVDAAHPGASAVTVEILGAAIAPGKQDGMAWDAVPAAKIPPEADAEIRKALAEPDGTKKVGPLLAKLIAKGIEPPDPQGSVQAFTGDGAQGGAVKLARVENSFAPTWSGVKLEHVKMDPQTRIHVSLEDADEGTAADLIGNVDVSSAALRDALAKGQPTDIRFDGSHILFITIQVRAE
jgi:hypothetical protein